MELQKDSFFSPNLKLRTMNKRKHNRQQWFRKHKYGLKSAKGILITCGDLWDLVGLEIYLIHALESPHQLYSFHATKQDLDAFKQTVSRFSPVQYRVYMFGVLI